MDKLFTDPKLAALMAAGSSMLQSSGPSRVPIGFGQALGSAFPAAQQAYMGAENAQYMRMAQQDKQRELLKKIEGDTLIKNLIDKQQSTGEPFNVKSFGQELIKSGNPYAIQVGMNYIKAAPKVKGMNKVMVDGQASFQPYFDDGTFGATSDLPAAEKLMQINRGNQIDLANPYTGQSQTSLSMGMSPGESARIAQSDRHFSASHGLARENSQRAAANSDWVRQVKMMEMNPEYLSQRASAIEQGKMGTRNQLEAQAGLQQTLDQGNETIDLIDSLISHPGFGLSVGKTAPIGSMASFIPGTQAASFDATLRQIKGKNFLQAFETLKGGGQITEIEGIKATEAMSRMEKANTEEDFIKSAQEVKNIIKKGMERAKSKAGISSTSSAVDDGWGELE